MSDIQIKKIPKTTPPPSAEEILQPSDPNPQEEEEHVIEMNFNQKSDSQSKEKQPEPEPPKGYKYVYALLYEENLDPQEAKKFVEIHLKPIAETAQVTYLAKEKQFLLWVWQTEADKIQKLIQAIIDHGKYVYINDGSEVIFRPGMRYNQINHQRMQLMNYRCYLDRNDPKKFKVLVRPIFLNKQYWIIEDGQDFAETIKSAFKRKTTVNPDGSKNISFEVDHNLIRKWVDKGLVHAQYESLKLKRQDFKAEFEKKKDLDYNPKLLKAIKDVEKNIKEMREIYGRRLKEIKKKQKLEEERLRVQLASNHSN